MEAIILLHLCNMNYENFMYVAVAVSCHRSIFISVLVHYKLYRQQCSHEDHVSEVMKRNEEERVSLKQHQESIRQVNVVMLHCVVITHVYQLVQWLPSGQPLNILFRSSDK